MLELNSVSNPRRADLEAMTGEEPRRSSPGSPGAAPSGDSRSAKFLLVSGRADPRALESVIGADERTRILDTELAPWRMICSLRMRGPSGGGAIGTGWFVGPRTIITAGHCVYSDTFFGGWASEIHVAPGRNENEFPFQQVTSRKFSSVDRWVSKEDPDFDIGCIHLEQPLGEQTGWFGIGSLPDGDLTGLLVNVSGYPGDLARGDKQYFHADRVLQVTERRIFYANDTFGGQSGAPVWIYEAGDRTRPLAVGIHAYGVGGTPASLSITANSAPRIIPEVFNQIQAWIQDGP